MPKPNSREGWEAILNMIEWAQRCWSEVQKAQEDVAILGCGFLRVTRDGIQHIPAHATRGDSIRVELPQTE